MMSEVEVVAMPGAEQGDRVTPIARPCSVGQGWWEVVPVESGAPFSEYLKM